MKVCEGRALWIHAFTNSVLYGSGDCQLHASSALVWRKEPPVRYLSTRP